MSLWRDEKYLRLLGPSLERFTQKSAHHFNFRCPLCGDSETNKSKARGYIFPVQDALLYKCHNCGIALPLSALLKRQNRQLYNDYILERMKEDGKRSPAPAPERSPEPASVPVVRATPAEWPVYSLETLNHAHPDLHSVLGYARHVRKLPETAFSRLFATGQAKTWLEPLIGAEKASKVANLVPYLVQPLRLTDGEWYGAQLRNIERKEFYTFRWSHEPLKVFGLDHWKSDALTYIVEGPIDSLFLPNCLSPCGSDLLSGIRLLEDADILSPSTRRVYIWDNEPRNKEIVRHIRTAVKLGENVVIWPRSYPKDINDCVRAGIDVNTVVPKRTFRGLTAELEFSAWLRP
jgi:hypothetical protein